MLLRPNNTTLLVAPLYLLWHQLCLHSGFVPDGQAGTAAPGPTRPTSPSWRGEQASSFGLSLAICLSLTHTEEMGGVTLVTLGRTHAWLCVCAGQRWACEWAEVRSGRGATWTLSAQGPPQRRWDSESTLLPIGSKCDLLTKFTGKVGSETEAKSAEASSVIYWLWDLHLLTEPSAAKWQQQEALLPWAAVRVDFAIACGATTSQSVMPTPGKHCTTLVLLSQAPSRAAAHLLLLMRPEEVRKEGQKAAACSAGGPRPIRWRL